MHLLPLRRHAAASALAAAAAAVLGLLSPPGAAAAQAATRTLEYHGLRMSVPASWPIVDLTANPRTCVRFDAHAVYLGHPSAAQSCPADLVGRSEALLAEPLDGTTATATAAGPGTSVAAAGTATYIPAANAPLGERRFAVPSAGVVLTATFGSGAESTADAILRSVQLTSAAPAARATTPAAITPAAASGTQPGTYLGRGFDPCTAPSSGTMSTWYSSSPYHAIGVYIGGADRSCSQPNLTASWVATVTSYGWHLFPLYVGSQAPCLAGFYNISYDPSTAYNEGVNEANDAANQASALGLPGNSTVYNDMEAYDNSNASCSTGVLNYISGWTAQLHARGYLSGEYSSASSGITDLVRQVGRGVYALPDQIDYAWWNGVADTNGGSYIPSGDWSNHQRIHQYHGGANETYGGITINVDGDYLDVAAAGSPPPPPPPPAVSWVNTFQNAPVYASPYSPAQTGTLNAGNNYVYCKVWGPVVGNASAYNHWWLYTDPDSGPAGQYVSAYYLSKWGNDQALDINGNAIANCATTPQPAAKYWVDMFANATVYNTPWQNTITGTLYSGTDYVYCKQWGNMVGNSTSYNHWWLLTDPDIGSARQYVSAYYLSRWGNDQALDNSGQTIPDC
ncbi:MAG TPA: DUF1906 domain-containing protein [Actinocrinis sp.]|uniref:DUF1906 domain-containing protein n=1 Tax=Actinocrinis sp. TaxID=1920516 RepID=UPI002DDC9E86|nr:DUF1906 domain-containing protein [Actinocrinis sp.]HEV2345278.1 DUF1906 domain-containing protein [Actinocrinis sp.]